MAEWHVQPEWLASARGLKFYYPCSGPDWVEPLEVFGTRASAPMAKGRMGAKLIAARHKIDGVHVSLRLESTAAPEVLETFAERSIGIFMHRGDSTGEGGSDLWFLSEKSGNGYWQLLSSKLADRALIVTDGSNADIFPPQAESGFVRVPGHPRFEWQYVGFLQRKNGPTRVLGVKRNSEGRP
jgi:hypothetical protein